ncbi:MAG: proline dehydrogenase family protein [Myxococcales bacterium]|nr:proline dehydrogenase family protein [Myxococcales bacterium]
MAAHSLPAARVTTQCSEQTIDGRVWRLRWLSDLDDAVCSPPGTCHPSVLEALLPWLAVAPEDGSPFRAHLDPGHAELGALISPQDKTIRLGSPRFAMERRLSVLLADGDAGADASEFADAWLQADPGDTPLDIRVATQHFGLPNLLDERDDEVLEKTATLAADVTRAMKAYRPGMLERLSQWGLGLQADYPVLRVHVLRFVALLPSLNHDRQGAEVQRLLLEMLRRTQRDDRKAKRRLPLWVSLSLAVGLVVSAVLPATLVAWLTRRSVERLAGIFIAGRNIDAAAQTLADLQSSGRGATVDQLGELVLSEAEADRYRDEVLALVGGVARQYGHTRNSAGIPLAHVSVKASALCAHYDADDPEGTWARVGPRLGDILLKAQQSGVFVHLDAEHYAVRDLTLEMLKRALEDHEILHDWADVGIVVQAYLRDAPSHLRDVLALAQARGQRMPVRLVKGAYWDAETTHANAHSFDAPQWLNKAETDVCFQQLIALILAHGGAAQLCIGSHNLRDHCFARVMRELRYPDAPEIEHQALHATYEALSTGMAKMGWAVRNYIPVGSLLVGMAYLVRRIMENSSQVGVLTMARGGVSLPETLRTPADALAANPRLRVRPTLVAGPTSPSTADYPRFASLAPQRLYRPAHRSAFERAITQQTLPRPATERPGRAGPWLVSHNPSRPDAIVGRLQTCSPADVTAAVQRAEQAAQQWATRGALGRGALLVRAAERMAGRRNHFAVLVASEAGKSRAEALGDVDEAVDFLRFYADEARRLSLLPDAHTRSPRGVIAVIAPWNFPLAIPAGMTCAALAAGNTVLLKSAEQTPLVAEALVDLLHEVGIPASVVQHLPGDGPIVGAALVADPRVAGCVFTGSKAVGTMLHNQLAGTVMPDGAGRLVITEMGGKNAVIVTANADLDEAVSGCLSAAFAHAGQKCSAASRLLVDRRIFSLFVSRLTRAAADLQVGGALTPGVQINPVIDTNEQQRLCDAQESAAAECQSHGGQVHLPGGSGAGAEVRPAIFELPAAAARQSGSFARQELFGPVVHVVPYNSLDEAVSLFNSTEYALTGGIFAQSEDDVDSLSGRLRCGNLYVNRPNTGARVAIEPFGGFAMSGTGPKAGGADYLPAFYRTRPERAIGGSPRVDLSGETLTQERRWPTPDMRRPGDVSRAARSLIDRLTAFVPQAADELTALADLLDQPGNTAFQRQSTHRVPGQLTHNHHDLPRGPTVIVAGRPNAGATGLLHLIGALVAGNPVVISAPPEAQDSWRIMAQAATNRGFAGVHLDCAHTAGHSAAWASHPELATLVIDGPRAPWSQLLNEAFCRRQAARRMPRVYCAADGPSLSNPKALLRAHRLVRTVAVNTMRHGAPLVLPSD